MLGFCARLEMAVLPKQEEFSNERNRQNPIRTIGSPVTQSG